MNADLWCARFEEHSRARSLAERTIGGLLCDTRHFLGFLADRGISEPHQLTRQEVEAYQVSLLHRRKPNGDPLSLRSRHTKMSAVIRFLRFLHQTHAILVNPGRGIKQPRLPRKLLPKLPTVEDVARLLEAPDVATPLGLRDRAVLEVLYSSALRNGELRRLRLEDMDLERLELRLHDSKGRKSRAVPLGEPAAVWVEKYLHSARGYFLRHREPGFVFLSLRGTALSISTLTTMVTRYARAAKLEPKVTPHTLRHCCATHMLARQAGLRHLQEMLGHASPDTTQVYTQVDLSSLRAVHQQCHPRESF
jgi:integrase/recombinase XerD